MARFLAIVKADSSMRVNAAKAISSRTQRAAADDFSEGAAQLRSILRPPGLGQKQLRRISHPDPHLNDPGLPPSRVRSIRKANERAADLTRQLLAYPGKGRFVIEELDLSRLVQKIAALLQSSIPKKVRAWPPTCPGWKPIPGSCSRW